MKSSTLHHSLGWRLWWLYKCVPRDQQIINPKLKATDWGVAVRSPKYWRQLYMLNINIICGFQLKYGRGFDWRSWLWLDCNLFSYTHFSIISSHMWSPPCSQTQASKRVRTRYIIRGTGKLKFHLLAQNLVLQHHNLFNFDSWRNVSKAESFYSVINR